MIEKRIQKKTIENLEVLVNENDEILISQLLQSIKNYGIKFDNALISIYNKEETEKCKIKLIYHREVQKLRQY